MNRCLTKTILFLMIRLVSGCYRDISMFLVSDLNEKLQTNLWFKNIKILGELGLTLSSFLLT